MDPRIIADQMKAANRARMDADRARSEAERARRERDDGERRARLK